MWVFCEGVFAAIVTPIRRSSLLDCGYIIIANSLENAWGETSSKCVLLNRSLVAYESILIDDDHFQVLMAPWRTCVNIHPLHIPSSPRRLRIASLIHSTLFRTQSLAIFLYSSLSRCSNLVSTTCLLVSSISPAKNTSSRIA